MGDAFLNSFADDVVLTGGDKSIAGPVLLSLRFRKHEWKLVLISQWVFFGNEY